MEKQLTFIDFFSGIGGFRLGFERAGHKCIGNCEKDKFATNSYRAMFDTKGDWFADDITTVKSSDIPYADIWTFGFPCQDISVAGHQKGLDGERSGLYFKILNLVKGKEERDKPRWLVAENVKNLLSIGCGWDFLTVLSEMGEAGYDVEWQVFNSKNFGVPQNRERVFIIGHLRTDGRRKILPIEGTNAISLKQVIGGAQGYRVYDSGGVSCTLASGAGGIGAKTGLYLINNNGGEITCRKNFNCLDAHYYKGLDAHRARTGVLEAYPVLTPDRTKKRQNGRRMKQSDEPMFTLTSQDRHGVMIIDDQERRNNQLKPLDICSTRKTQSHRYEPKLVNGCRIRRLTPKECFRLQGFPDELYEKARAVNSDSQLYKQAGNAVTVSVTHSIASRLNMGEKR